MPESPGAYWKRLDTYEEEGLEELKRRTGKRREKRTRQIKKDSRRTKKRVSRTDPEAGHMKRPGKPRGQYYLSHQTLDSDHGIIVGLTVTPGDVHDTVPYLNQLETLHQTVIPFAARLRIPPMISLWPTGSWRSWESHFSSGPRPSMTAHR